MRISVFGLGYVGAVTAGCLAGQGHDVVGIDNQHQKVADFNQGRSPIAEPGLEELISRAYAKGLLRATQSCAEAISASEISLICVGTPSQPSGALDQSHVQEVIREITEAIREKPKSHLLFIRSTLLPGSTRAFAQGLLRELIANGSVQLFYYPEFLREGTAVADFQDPSLALIGTQDGQSFPVELKALLERKMPVVTWETAEMTKYACNAFHATKVVFTNEIGRLSKQLGIDAQAVLKLLCEDFRLNLSPYYLKPGNPFGGSCLPKDVQALAHFGRQHGLYLPLVENLLTSNQEHLKSLLDLIARRDFKEVVILGLSFKSNTDDLRGSAMVDVAQHLLMHGCEVRIYDPQLQAAHIVGSNRRMLDTRMPRWESLLHENLHSALGAKGLVLAAQRCAALAELAKCLTAQHHIIDVNGWPGLRDLPASYEGFCW